MRVAPDVITAFEVWERRHEPESADLLRALRLAERLESDQDAPLALLSIAHRLVVDLHEAVGWRVPAGVRLSRCASVSASIRHGCSLLLERVRAELGRPDGTVILWGPLGASKALFGCWDALPAHGEVLVRVDDRDLDPLPSDPLGQHGVRWAGTGELGRVMAHRSVPTTIGERQVLVPSPGLYVALANPLRGDESGVAALVFCAAARAVATAGAWVETLELAHSLGRGRAPVETAMRLGITDWLGLSVGPVTRVSVALSRLVGRRQPKR